MNSLTSSKSALTLNGVDYSVQGQTILEQVSFTLFPGEFVSFFGPNGGGKTTLLHLMMGFLMPDKGTIEVFGHLPVEARFLMGCVPQHFRPDPLFPICVLEVVCLGLMRASHNKERAKEALQQVGMEKYASTQFGALSGGQAQRVLLARALVSDPPLLFLDEPTASLDPSVQETIYGLLAQLKGKRTLVMVTHDLQGALALSDRLFCVNRTVQEHLPETLCHHFLQGLYHRGNP